MQGWRPKVGRQASEASYGTQLGMEPRMLTESFQPARLRNNATSKVREQTQFILGAHVVSVKKLGTLGKEKSALLNR